MPGQRVATSDDAGVIVVVEAIFVGIDHRNALAGRRDVAGRCLRLDIVGDPVIVLVDVKVVRFAVSVAVEVLDHLRC